MNMEKVMLYLAVALIAVLVLTVITNLIVMVTKKVVAWNKFPVQIWVFIVSMVLTFLTAGAVSAYFMFEMYWYYWVAVSVVGILVCYAAMFGYDNLYKQLRETVGKARKLISDITSMD